MRRHIQSTSHLVRVDGILALMYCYWDGEIPKCVLNAGLRTQQPAPGFTQTMCTHVLRAAPTWPGCKVIEERSDLFWTDCPVWIRRVDPLEDLDAITVYTRTAWKGRTITPSKWQDDREAGEVIIGCMNRWPDKPIPFSPVESELSARRRMEAEWRALLETLRPLGWDGPVDDDFPACGPVPIAELELGVGPFPPAWLLELQRTGPDYPR